MNKISDSIKIKKVDHLDIGSVWYDFENEVFQADNIVENECFYPVYKWKNYYSYSPFKLLMLKGGLEFNNKIFRYLNNGIIDDFLPPEVSIDVNIKRVGSPLVLEKTEIFEKDNFLNSFATAMINDMRFLESLHPKAIFGILVGGKDSLNILLLPWNCKIIAFSAEPNYSLVEKFVKDNNLNIQVEKLDLYSFEEDILLEKEILFNFFRIGLHDVRWVSNLFMLKTKLEKDSKELIVITGSLADTFLTPTFFSYKSKWRLSKKYLILDLFKSRREIFFQNLWERGAQWQGIYHGVLRESASIINYSMYHGKCTKYLLSISDIKNIVTHDLREDLGFKIVGSKILYPQENPSPFPWYERVPYVSIQKFIDTLIHNVPFTRIDDFK